MVFVGRLPVPAKMFIYDDPLYATASLATYAVPQAYVPFRSISSPASPCGQVAPVAPVGQVLPCGQVAPVAPVSPVTPCGQVGQIRPLNSP